MRKLTLFLTVCLGLSFLLSAATKEQERVMNAASVLREIMAAPDKGIPLDVLHHAACVAVIPALKKGGLGFSGEHGAGIVACRKENGAWGSPSMLTMTGGGFGFQIGVQSIDVIMVIRNRRGIDFLTKDKFEVRGDTSAAAGPDTAGNAEIYVFTGPRPVRRHLREGSRGQARQRRERGYLWQERQCQGFAERRQ